jgi:hypothetical protein
MKALNLLIEGFLIITNSERKNDLLLIEVFGKLVNTKN